MLGGKNTSAIPRIVVRNPLVPASNIVVRLYRPRGSRLSDRKFYERSKHIDERYKLQNHRQRQESLKHLAGTAGLRYKRGSKPRTPINLSQNHQPKKFPNTKIADTIPCTINAAYGVA